METSTGPMELCTWPPGESFGQHICQDGPHTRETVREKSVGESQIPSGILWDTPIQGRSELGPDRTEGTEDNPQNSAGERHAQR